MEDILGPGHPEDTIKLHEEMAQMPMVPISTTRPSLSQPAPVASQEFPVISWQRKRRRRPRLQMVLRAIQAPPESLPLQHDSPVLEHPWRTEGRGNLPSEQSFNQCTSMATLLERKIGQICKQIPICGPWPMVWLMVRDLEGTWLEIGNKEIWGMGMWIDLSEWS